MLERVLQMSQLTQLVKLLTRRQSAALIRDNSMRYSSNLLFRGYLAAFLACNAVSGWVEFSKGVGDFDFLWRAALALGVGLAFPLVFFYHLVYRKPISFWSFSYDADTTEVLRVVYMLASGCVGLYFSLYAFWA